MIIVDNIEWRYIVNRNNISHTNSDELSFIVKYFNNTTITVIYTW